MDIKVIDEIMGVGKTTQMIEDINQNKSTQSYLIIVPTLGEVSRYAKECSIITPVEIKGKRTKKQHLREILYQGDSIVTTHKMFSLWDEEFNGFVESNQYEVVIDEETTCISPFMVKNSVIEELRVLGLINSDPHSDRLIWNTEKGGDGYNTNPTHNEVKSMCTGYNVSKCKEDTVIEFPPDFFRLNLNCTILTYMFEESYMAAYLHYQGIPYEVSHLLSKEEYAAKKQQIREHIEVIKPKTKNFIGKGVDTSYSHSFYKNLSKEEFKTLRSSVGTYIKRLGFNKENTLYACPKTYSVTNNKDGLYAMPRGYKRLDTKDLKGTWIAYNHKASNDYKHNLNMVYMMNVYPNVGVYRYISSKLKEKGYDVLKKDDIALTTILQCVWRMGIRENPPKNIKLLILSNRMETLFTNWLNKDER